MLFRNANALPGKSIADEVKMFVSFIKYTCYNRTILNSKQGSMQYEQYFSQNQRKKT